MVPGPSWKTGAGCLEFWVCIIPGVRRSASPMDLGSTRYAEMRASLKPIGSNWAGYWYAEMRARRPEKGRMWYAEMRATARKTRCGGQDIGPLQLCRGGKSPDPIPASPLYPPCCAVRKGLGGGRKITTITTISAQTLCAQAGTLKISCKNATFNRPEKWVRGGMVGRGAAMPT